MESAAPIWGSRLGTSLRRALRVSAAWHEAAAPLGTEWSYRVPCASVSPGSGLAAGGVAAAPPPGSAESGRRSSGFPFLNLPHFRAALSLLKPWGKLETMAGPDHSTPTEVKPGMARPQLRRGTHPPGEASQAGCYASEAHTRCSNLQKQRFRERSRFPSCFVTDHLCFWQAK